MSEKHMHEHLLDMLDYAELLIDMINAPHTQNTNPTIAPGDIEDYFMTLVYIEDIFDKYGRGFIRQSMQENSLTTSVTANTMLMVNERLEILRKQIRELVQTHDFTATLQNRSQELITNWQRRQE